MFFGQNFRKFTGQKFENLGIFGSSICRDIQGSYLAALVSETTSKGYFLTRQSMTLLHLYSSILAILYFQILTTSIPK